MNLLKPVTSDSDLIKLADLVGVRIDAIYDNLEINTPLPKSGSYLILLRKTADIGHWVALHNGFYFDSMGEAPPPQYGIQKIQ